MILFDNYDFIYCDPDIEHDDFESALRELECITRKNDYEIDGYVQRWNGKYPLNWRLSQFKNIGDFIYQAINDCDYIKIEKEDDDSKIFLTCSHHDGMNYFELSLIN